MIRKWIEFSVEGVSTSEFKAALTVLERASKEEEGCVYYSAFQSADEETLFTVLESWATKEDFENHRIAVHTNSFKEQCGGMILHKKALSLNPLSGAK
ncbi:MAG: antibiotic biosynthesis monooxygenase [Lentisphaeraceae bacterium]|nr:antibiotic biosynthesis monooxygenase [Lentisphaeraceae bacterium]